MKLTTFLTPEQLDARVHALAAEIRARHADHPLTVVCILKGAWIFAADLVRALSPHDVRVEFVAASSYEGTETTGKVHLLHDLRRPIAGEHVLLVEDIVDTGLTLSFLVDLLRAREPASLEVAALLDKPSRRKVRFEADYVGFEIPDLFVIGYGLDLDQRFRHLPYVGLVEEA